MPKVGTHSHSHRKRDGWEAMGYGGFLFAFVCVGGWVGVGEGGGGGGVVFYLSPFKCNGGCQKFPM